ncbi:MAG: hypothetical protein ISS11_08040 [Candidatus Marinimicrobia bacterium]|nr:hypothetical protein [Candidatus Neomarinimicrobiota bacterium]
MTNLNQRLAFSIKEIIEENFIPYAKAAKTGEISLLELEQILSGQSELSREDLTKIFIALDRNYSIM